MLELPRESKLPTVVFAAILGFAFANAAVAQKAPELGYVFPPTVQAGTESSVQLGGYDFTPDMQFFVHDDRVKLSVLGEPGEFIIPKPPYWFGEKSRLTAFPIPREIPARIQVSSDVPPGLVRWQVANANGTSPTAVFYVSDGHEVVENRYRDEPQLLDQLPIGVSGRLERIAEVDRYLITAQLDGPVTVELFARRLGADFNGVVAVRDAEGRLLEDTADTQGLDTELTFAATAGATYTISLHDVDFRGHSSFVYRLALTAGPRVVATMPAAAQRGATLELDFIGYGVTTGTATLETTRRTIQVPADPQQDFVHYELETDHGNAAPVRIPLGDLAETTISAADVATELPAPCGVTSILDATGEQSFTWTAGEGEFWSITAQSRAIGTDLDLSLQVLNPDGGELAKNDDLAGTPDAGLRFTAPTAGTYTCVVKDLSGRSGRATSVYRLAIERLRPDFAISVPQVLTAEIPGKSDLKVTAVRSGGHAEEIAIELRGLPEGVTAPADLKIPGDKSEVSISLEVSAEAPARAALIEVVGTSTVGEETVTQTATSVAAGDLCPRNPGDATVSRTLVATRLTPQFSVELIDKNRQRDVHRGTTYPAPFVIKRDEGFRGEIMLQMAARQGRHRQGIYGPIVTVAADATDALYPCFMPEWLETDRTTRMVVLGVAKQKDPHGTLRYVTKPADARITMILEGALLKVSHSAGELTVRAGESFQIPVHLARSAKLQTPVTLQLEMPDEISGLVQSNPATLEIPPDQDHAMLTVQTSPDSRLTGRWTLQVTANTQIDQQWPVLSQCDVTVEFESVPDPSVSATNGEE